jgi:NAD(P)-dependent dehydrogenase (short-subunit alcohol dehydrogenase family)
VVLITGCSSGIGLEIAIGLAKLSKFIVYATMRDISKSEHTILARWKKAQEEGECNGRLHVLYLDVTNVQSIEKCVAQILQQENRIDILINNAGNALAGFAETTEDEQIMKIFDVNYFGVVRMFRAVLPTMRSQKSGHIITISSTSAIRAPTGLGFYAATKSAVESLHTSEAAMLAQWNIRLTLLQVGTTMTNDKLMAEKVEFGSRKYPKPEQENGDIYAQLLNNYQRAYINHIHTAGIPVSSVVNQIKDIINNKEGSPIEQTEGEAQLIARAVYIDPSGSSDLRQETYIAESFLNDS